MIRDFTYIDDIVESLFRLILKSPSINLEDMASIKEGSLSNSYHQIFNIGNSKKIKLLDFIKELETSFKIKAEKNFLEMQPGDVKTTFADCSKLEKYINFKPNTNLRRHKQVCKWYKEYY